MMQSMGNRTGDALYGALGRVNAGMFTEAVLFMTSMAVDESGGIGTPNPLVLRPIQHIYLTI
jgi:hypothetical protein